VNVRRDCAVYCIDRSGAARTFRRESSNESENDTDRNGRPQPASIVRERTRKDDATSDRSTPRFSPPSCVEPAAPLRLLLLLPRRPRDCPRGRIPQAGVPCRESRECGLAPSRACCDRQPPRATARVSRGAGAHGGDVAWNQHGVEQSPCSYLVIAIVIRNACATPIDTRGGGKWPSASSRPDARRKS